MSSGTFTKYSRRHATRQHFRQRRSNGNRATGDYQETSVNLVSYNMACREVLRQHNIQRPQYYDKETSERMHQEIVKAAYAKFGLEFNESAYHTGTRFKTVEEEKSLEKSTGNELRRNSVITSGEESTSSSDSEGPAPSVTLTEKDQGSFVATPSFTSSTTTFGSGSASPMPSDSSASTSTSFNSPRGFVFLPGTVNAPGPLKRTIRIPLENGSFEIIEDPELEDPKPAKKQRVFSPDEIQRQSTIVEEMKLKIQKSLHQ